MNQSGNPNQIQVSLDEKTGQGIYSNLALISHSNAEIIIDFTRLLPGLPKAAVQARIILTPQHAKGLLQALEDNIKKYENRYGEIKAVGGKGEAKSFGFQPAEPSAE